MKFELGLKFSTFAYLYDESAMCAGFGGWKLLLKKGRLLLISGWVKIPLFREKIMFIYRKHQKVAPEKEVFVVYLLSAGTAEILGADEGIYTYFLI